MIHRLVFTELYRDSPTAIRTRWALRDLIAAHRVLDAVDAEQERTRREAEQRRPRGAHG